MKFPVFRSIAETFSFIGSNLLDILRIVWAPALLMGVINVLVLPRYFANMSAFMSLGAQPAPQQVMEAAADLLPDMLLLLAFDLIAYPVIFAGLLKLLLMNERPPRIAYLGFGLEELRIIGSWALLFVILFGLVLLAQVASGAARAMGQIGGGVGQAIGIVLEGAVLALMLWVGARLSMATPAAVTEQRIGVSPAWTRTKGALLSLLLFWTIFLIAGFLIQTLVGNLLSPELARIAAEAAQAQTDDAAMEALRRLNEATAMSFNWSEPANLLRFAIQHTIATAMVAIIAIATGIAWRHLRAARAA